MRDERNGLGTTSRVGLTGLLPLLGGAAAAFLVLGLGVVGAVVVVVGLVLPWLLREPFRLFVVLVITWPIATLYVGHAMPSGVPDLRYERILILLLMLLLVSQSLVSKRRLPGLAPAVAILVAVQVILYLPGPLASDLIAPDPVTLVNATLAPVAMYWLAKVFITSRSHLKWLLLAMVVGGALIALTGFYERAIDAVESPFPVATGTSSGGRYLGVPGGRAAGVVGNPAIYGAILGIGVLAGLAHYLHARRAVTRFAYAMTTLVLVFGVFVSFTRSAWLAAFAAVAAAPVFMKGLRRRTARLAVVAIVVAAVAIPLAIDEVADNSVIQERVLEGQNVSGRVERAQYSLEKFGERPLLGWGSGALNELIAEEFAGGGSGFDSSHNTYLTLLVEGGLVAFAAFMAVVVFWAWAALRGFRRHSHYGLEASAIGVMVGTGLIFLISGLFIELKYFPYFNSLFWMAGATLENLAAPRFQRGTAETDTPSDTDAVPVSTAGSES